MYTDIPDTCPGSRRNGRNADLFHFDQQHLRLATGSGYHLHSCNDHGRQYTDYRLCQKHGPGSLPRCYSKSYDHASDSGKCTAERSGYYTATGVSGVTDGGASISAQLDEVFTVEQCLYAIMLASANDVALQIAEQIGGSVDGFVQMMNNRAVELGCTNTVFTNPTGLPDENQHTTAHDMALITKAAIDNESFRAIAETTSYTIPATNVSGGERVLTNNFSMLNNTNASYYQYCLGGREGYTEASGSTLVCGAEKNGVSLIAVVLQGASGTTAAEAVSLLNYGFDNFQLLSLGDNDFDMASGGNVFVPNGTTADALTTQDGEVQDGQYNRQFLFNGTPVGTAVMSVTSPEEDTAVIEASTQNLTNAQDYTVSHTSVPYFVIGGIGLFLLLLILFRIVKVAKS